MAPRARTTGSGRTLGAPAGARRATFEWCVARISAVSPSSHPTLLVPRNRALLPLMSLTMQACGVSSRATTTKTTVEWRGRTEAFRHLQEERRYHRGAQCKEVVLLAW